MAAMLMSSNDRPATLHYGPNGFRVVTPGSHVICAVTGEAVPLDTLRYWSVKRQEPYANCEVATRRLLERA
jgi:hypothetical protein